MQKYIAALEVPKLFPMKGQKSNSIESSGTKVNVALHQTVLYSHGFP